MSHCLLSEKAGISWKEKGRTAFCIKEEARHLLRSRSTGERHPEDGSASKHFQMRIFFSQERAILQSTPSSFLYQKLQRLLEQISNTAPHSLLPTTKRHPGPKKPRHGIPPEEWPTVLRRVIDNQEPLRNVTEDYGVSYETVTRTVLAAQKKAVL